MTVWDFITKHLPFLAKHWGKILSGLLILILIAIIIILALKIYKVPIWNGVINKECPEGMVNAGAFCIDQEPRFARGTENWFENNKECIEVGLRMCTTAEISGAVQSDLINTYDANTDGYHWVWADDVVLSRDEGGGVHDACYVTLNPNQPHTTLGEWNCVLSANETHEHVGGMCCK